MSDNLSPYFSPGAVARPLDLRDIKLKTVRPATGAGTRTPKDISWLKPIYQSWTPLCGPHAASHLKSILDHADASSPHVPLAPFYGWKRIKQIDGFPPEVGTDMRSILKVLESRGLCDYDMLPNDFSQTLAQITDSSVITPAMDENAHPRIVNGYGFGNPAEVKDDIDAFGAVLLLININTQGGTWWGAKVPHLDPAIPKTGHFVTAYDYTETTIKIIDSADKAVPLKELPISYPIRETGTAVDLPDSQIKELTGKLVTLQKIVGLMQQVLKLKSLLRP